MRVASPPRLLCFAPMIDSELCRLVLSHYGVPYAEERHVFVWASILALRRGQTVQIPLLYGSGMRLAGPRAIVARFDQTCPPDRTLLPAAQPLRTRVEDDWERYHGRLATSTAAFAYFHLLPHPDILMEPFSRGVPAWEASALRAGFYGVLRSLLTTLLRLTPATAQDAQSQIRATFDHTDAAVADGRRFLHGDRLTLSDLALASAAAPVLLPAGYRSPIPKLSDMPEPMAGLITELQTRPTAGLVKRIYAAAAPASVPGQDGL